MKKNLFTNELKTGLVIVAAILIGIFFWFRTSNFRSATYTLKTYFTQPDGIKENAIVTLSGIEVGRVIGVNFVYKPEETKVELILEIDKKAKVREDSIAYVCTTGFVGDAYIGLTPGTSKIFVKSNATLTSEDPVQMRELMKKADQIATRLDVILGDVKTIVSENKDKVNNIVTNLEGTALNFKEFSADIKAHPWKLLMKGKDTTKKKKR